MEQRETNVTNGFAIKNARLLVSAVVLVAEIGRAHV